MIKVKVTLKFPPNKHIKNSDKIKFYYIESFQDFPSYETKIERFARGVHQFRPGWSNCKSVAYDYKSTSGAVTAREVLFKISGPAKVGSGNLVGEKEEREREREREREAALTSGFSPRRLYRGNKRPVNYDSFMIRFNRSPEPRRNIARTMYAGN